MKKTIILILSISLPAICYASEENKIAVTPETIDNLWVLIAASLVFFMQAGFKVLESGLVKKEHKASIGAKNLMDWVAGCLAFFIIGFGIMFGRSEPFTFSTDFFFGSGLTDTKTIIFFLFQLAFAGTALTIVSGAMSGRTALVPYFLASFVTAILIYPVFGSWAWGNLLYTENSAWLADLGFIDFAGSTVVHSVGAWVGLVGIWLVGPRLGKYNLEGEIRPTKASDYSYSILGVMILWLGWWGFNGGSTLAFNEDVPLIILNTNIAAAAATFSAFVHAILFQKKEAVIEKIAGGALTGLVAITACCNIVSPQSSFIIGLLAGVIHNLALVLISKKWKLDDPVGAIAVHGFGGIFGTLSVALFGKQELLPLPRWDQLSIQFLGIAICFLLTTIVSFILFTMLKMTIGLRVSTQSERVGTLFDDTNKSIGGDYEDKDNIVSCVIIRMSKDKFNLMEMDEFRILTHSQKQGLIDDERVEFINESGDKVEIEEAIESLEEQGMI